MVSVADADDHETGRAPRCDPGWAAGKNRGLGGKHVESATRGKQHVRRGKRTQALGSHDLGVDTHVDERRER